jgi:hypothetical protein
MDEVGEPEEPEEPEIKTETESTTLLHTSRFLLLHLIISPRLGHLRHGITPRT